MRKNGLITLLFTVLFLAALAVSCSPETVTEAPELVEASFAVSLDKGIYASVDTTVTHYTYTAIPLFSLETPAELVGRRSTEYAISGSNPEVSLGYFTAGRWTFHLWAYNQYDQLVREGETTLYLHRNSSGITNEIPITLYRSETRHGNVSFEILTNNVSSSGARFSLSYSYDNGAFTSETFQTSTCETVTWNQRMTAPSASFGLTVSESDGWVHVRGKATSSGTLVLSGAMTSGHKYYVNAAYGAEGNESRNISCDSLSLPSSNGTAIVTASGSGTVYKSISSGTIYDFWYRVSIIDLTTMYGSGKEPAISAFETTFPRAWYSYSNNEVINMNRHTFSLTNLRAGAYVFDIKLYDGSTHLGGASVATYVVGKEPAELTTRVTGFIYPAEQINAAFSITLPDPILGGVGQYQVQGTLNTAHTFTWTPASGSATAVKYIWYRDGVEVQNGASSTYTWTPTSAGAYTVSCIAVSASGTEQASGVCLLVVSQTQAVFGQSWSSPTGTKTMTMPGTASASSLIRVSITDSSGISIYTNYLTLTASGSGYISSISAGGATFNFTISGNSISMACSGSTSGKTIRVEGKL